MKRGKLATVFVLVIIFLLAACANDKKVDITTEKQRDKEVTKPVEPKETVKQITLSAIGDILIHDRVYNDAAVEDGYDFLPMLRKVNPFLSDTTITIANQETMIGGEEIGLSSYPAFNSPVEVGYALKDAGVDVVSIANNHTLDRGEKAIQQAIKNWETIDMMYTGAYKDKRDSENIRIYQTDAGISVAFLAYTYGTNGIPVPDGKDYLVNLIEKEVMAGAIKEAKKKADVTVLSLHFGDEYERMPNDTQKDLAQFAADNGVDVVLGHHPHVLQPLQWVKGKKGNKTLVAYSLGNFLSGQDEFYNRIGGILKFTIKQTTKEDGKKEIEVVAPKFMPTFVTFHDETDYRVVPMYQLTNGELKDADKHYQEIREHMSQWMPGLEFVEE
ncbi:CapA family protein [Virgibacillus dakarensis]|uniref:Capsular polysaccharide biosynthesis protein n=1 Tax=Lentibacillus populi TaxID=1827502 RepID=A0A9W5U1X4_9BACI|nr:MULTISPECIES: CapA family protein [Bacillaceae]MBT2214731.1 CapA family protein [Virgibacillus dakarensis]MTW85659.1 CapA family protein [Virgibacillus dakarensis]GGB61726.1 capsular polysaccharide biosynthesis protein [Lentibacillus populi]